MSTTNNNKKQIQKLKKQYKKEQKEYDRKLKLLSTKRETLRTKYNQIDAEYASLYHEKTKAYYKIEEQIQELCNHSEYPVRKSENLRDDASFKYWLFCSNCDKDMGHK